MKYEYSLIPDTTEDFSTFYPRKKKTKGCKVRDEYERWHSISILASQNGVEMDKYNQLLYAHRCPLLKRPF